METYRIEITLCWTGEVLRIEVKSTSGVEALRTAVKTLDNVGDIGEMQIRVSKLISSPAANR